MGFRLNKSTKIGVLHLDKTYSVFLGCFSLFFINLSCILWFY